MPIAVNTFPVPASRSIRKPIAPHTTGPASIVVVIASPVDIPAHESPGFGLGAMGTSASIRGGRRGRQIRADAFALLNGHIRALIRPFVKYFTSNRTPCREQ